MYAGIIFELSWPTGNAIFCFTTSQNLQFVTFFKRLNRTKSISNTPESNDNIIFLSLFRLVGCENAIGIMTKLQTSLATEETWVDGATEKLSALPTATSAFELDVSTNQKPDHNHYEYTPNNKKFTKFITPFLIKKTKKSLFSVHLVRDLFCIIIFVP